MANDPGVFQPNTGSATTSSASGGFPVNPTMGSTVPGLGTESFQPGPLGASQQSNDGRLLGPSARTQVPESVGVALEALMKDSPGTVLAIQKDLIKAGYLNPADQSFLPGDVGYSDATYQAYGNAMADAINKGEAFHKVLFARIDNPKNTTGQKFWAEYQAQQKDAGTGGATTATQTSTSINYLDPSQARAAAQSEYQSLLGRNLTDQEASAFQQALHSYEAANPNVTTQTATNNGAANTSSDSTVSSGGASDPTQFAEGYIMQHDAPEVASTEGEQIYQLFANLVG